MTPARSLFVAKALALGVPAALLAGAYVSQYVFGLFPCEMCWWQRYAHFVAVGFGLAAWAVRPGRLLVALAALAIAVAALLGGFHAGVEYGWWQGLTECSTTAAPDGDLLDAIMNAPIVRCDVAPWSLLGVSLAGWNFLVSGGAAIAIAGLLAKSGKEPA